MSRDCNGSNQMLRYDGNVGVADASAFTLHMLAKTDTLSPSDNRYFLHNVNDDTFPNGSFFFRIQGASDDLGVSIITSAGTFGGTVGLQLTDLNWHSYTLVWTGSELSGWLDGVKGGTTFATTGTFGNSTHITMIGGATNSFDVRCCAWDGLIAEASVYTTELNTKEISALSQRFSPHLVHPQNLVSYWEIFGQLSPEPDFVGHHDATLVNSPALRPHPHMLYPTQPMVIVPGEPAPPPPRQPRSGASPFTLGGLISV